LENLFTVAQDADRIRPLADEIRPTAFSDIIGQDHLLGENTILRRKIDNNRLGSIVLYGETGIGKTTIARAIGKHMKKKFIALHAAHHKTADIQKAAEQAKEESTIVFIDEIHRYSTTISDTLLSHTEAGHFELIGATSENPNFALSKALASRAMIFELKPLSVEDMERVLNRAVWKLKDEGMIVSFEGDALKMLAGRAGGDARRALNALEACTIGRTGNIQITKDLVEEVFNFSPIPYDRQGDAHYDVISAFVKSMRGSDEDATLYWLARLITSGEDPRFIARRIMIHASEDVGLADNTALQTAVAASQAVEKIGYPEARIILAHAALHVARAPKSNSAYRGISIALDYVETQPLIEVPMYLRDSHYKGAAALGRVGYQSPHTTELGWLKQDYAPGVQHGRFYQSDARSNSTFEGRADAFWDKIKGFKTAGTV
jgi:putative ATPase